jgi:hypothetical protein
MKIATSTKLAIQQVVSRTTHSVSSTAEAAFDIVFILDAFLKTLPDSLASFSYSRADKRHIPIRGLMVCAGFLLVGYNNYRSDAQLQQKVDSVKGGATVLSCIVPDSYIIRTLPPSSSRFNIEYAIQHGFCPPSPN